MEEKKHLRERIKEHKTEIIVACATIVSIAGAIMLASNWDAIKSRTLAVLVKKHVKVKADSVPVFETIVESDTIELEATEKIVDVIKHIRKLPAGQNASIAKLLTANDNGFELASGQTWVDAYSKVCA